MRYLITILFLFPLLLHSQRNNTWMLGYDYPTTGGAVSIGPMTLTFNNSIPLISVFPDTMRMYLCNASISDTSGNLLFYTNGLDIRDKNYHIMQNGDSLNYGDLWNDWTTNGLPLRQGALILPFPEHPNEYYLIHNTLKDYLVNNYYPTEVLYSKVDMSLNQGLGSVVSKNQVLSVIDKGDAAITACRHGNGRDWWLLFPIKSGTCYERFLLTPNGFENQGQACINGISFDAIGEAKYSHDGKKYARFQDSTVHIMDFDRCSGLYSNLLTIPIPYNPDSMGCGGVEFSPNSRYLYLMNCAYAYQYDMWASDIASSRITIGIVDGMPDPYLPGNFSCTALGLDNKIYITSSSSVESLSIIHAPDSAGLNCHFELRGFPLPRHNGTIPNFPDFKLGAAYGSGCDSFTTSTTAFVSSKQVKVYPNPAHTNIYIESPSIQNGIAEVLTVWGQKVASVEIVKGKGEIAIGNWAEGVYFYRIVTGKDDIYGKFVVQHF